MSDPTVTPNAAVFFRRCRFRGGCGPAASSSSRGRFASVTPSLAVPSSSTSRKRGRSGALVFVKVRHEIHRADEPSPAVIEFHDLVYRDAPTAGAAAPPPTLAPKTSLWERTISPDPVLLFRYSALTFNGHRIHYDRRYVTEVEGYPGLVVHGPLIATLLLDLLRREMPEADVARFQFKAVRPLFDLNPFSVCGGQGTDKTVRLWARDHEGSLAMDATALLR